MTLPYAERIIDNLLETFRGITTANGYRTDIKTVEDRGSVVGAPSTADCPAIYVYDDGEERSIVEPGLIRWFYPIAVTAFVQSTGRTGARSAMADLVRDIQRALFVDPTRGADPDIAGARNAVKTGAIQTRRRVRVPDQSVVSMELKFEVEYYERPAEA